MRALEINNLSMSYENGGRVLRNISLSADAGECIGIFGANGSGKSTLGYCICGLIPEVIEGDIEGFVKSKRAAIVIQNPESGFFSETVGEEIELGRKWLRLKERDILSEFGIEELRDKSLKELSGG